MGIEGKIEELSKNKNVTDLAYEVIAEKRGNGIDRKNNLTKAGYDYNKISLVMLLFSPYITVMLQLYDILKKY